MDPGENRTVYRINFHSVTLTDKEILFCVLSGVGASLFTESLGLLLTWLIPIAIGLTAAFLFSILHARYPGCVIERLRSASKEGELDG